MSFGYAVDYLDTFIEVAFEQCLSEKNRSTIRPIEGGIE